MESDGSGNEITGTRADQSGNLQCKGNCNYKWKGRCRQDDIVSQYCAGACAARQKVVVFDADFGLANVEVMLGIRPQYNLLDLIHNNKSMTEIITQGPEGIGFISGGSGVSELATLDNASIKLLISELVKLDQMYDVVIIDTGAGITDSVMEFVMMSPEVVLVVTPEPTSITDSYSLLKVLRRKNSFNPLYKTIHVVANRVEMRRKGQKSSTRSIRCLQSF